MAQNLSYTEENYIKAIYHLAKESGTNVSTNALAEYMSTRPATVSDMIKRLSKKDIIVYEKYKGVSLTSKGDTIALNVIRKHRLWEVFLHEKLSFNWDEVHEVAEQLEHVKSPLLIDRLDKFLGEPAVDPHGDPIPDKHGNFKIGEAIPLTEMKVKDHCVLVTVGNDDPRLLQHLDRLSLRLGSKIHITDIIDFDGSIEIQLVEGKSAILSRTIAQYLSVRKLN